MKKHKLEGTSYIPQKELLEALKSNFPSVFSDGKVDCGKLKTALGENYESANEKYGLSWTGKNDCFREIQTGTTATLKPQKDESVDFETTGNLFIEGDNLEVLKVLQRSYYGKVKCVYIDPPYNTGNDFIYNDNFRKTKKEELEDSGEMDGNGDLTRADGLSVNRKDSNGHFHSDWLNMMYPRLFLARNLLRQDGVIFVSIDDNEVHNLRMIMNEIFGEENFIGSFIWKKKGTSTNVKGAHLSSLTEYVIVYGRADLARLNPRVVRSESREYPFSDEIGNYRKTVIEKKSTGDYDRQSMKFKIMGISPRNGKRWQIGEESARELERKNRFIVENNVIKLKIYDFEDLDSFSAQPNLLLDFGSSQKGQTELDNLLSISVFDNPKPVKLIKHLVNISTNSEDIILDFFAGSGTTAQAVMGQNAEDGGNRKWICVQLPELCDEKSEAFKAGYKTIAEIAKERIRRAGKKVKEEKKNVDVGFKSLKLDKSNFKIWQGKFKDEKSLFSALDDFVDNLEKGSKKENILYELILKSGLDLNVLIEEKEIEGEKYFDLENGKLFIYLGENISIKMAEKFIEMKPEKIICLERAFQNNDELKTNVLLQAEQEDVDFKVV